MKRFGLIALTGILITACSSESPADPGGTSTDTGNTSAPVTTDFAYKPNVPAVSVQSVEMKEIPDTAYIYMNAYDWHVKSVTLMNAEDSSKTDVMLVYDDFDREIQCEWLKLANVDRHLLVTVAANTDAGRSAIISLEADNKNYSIMISQPLLMPGMGGDDIWLYPACQHVGPEGGEVRYSTHEFPWITDIKLDGRTYSVSESEREALLSAGPYPTVEADWLKLTRDGNDIVCTLDANTTGKHRSFEIDLQLLDFFTRATGFQTAD